MPVRRSDLGIDIRRRWRTSAARHQPCHLPVAEPARGGDAVEHLLAAITCMGVDNAVVELDHRECP